MGIFRGKKDNVANTAASTATGTINLTKGNCISLTKNDGGAIVVSCGWTAIGKDYDLKAIVLLRNDDTVYIGAANLDERLSILNGAVVHGGDVKEPGARETITINWHPDIAAIALSSYSALENGAGSFRVNGVYAEIVNGEQQINIAAADTSTGSNNYTLCFGEIIFGEDGSFKVVNHERYSTPGSENRIGYNKAGEVVMDSGPVGRKK